MGNTDQDLDIASVTCQLLDNMVTVCGEVWRQCHSVDQVETMRTMFVEKLIMSNRDATFNIQECDSIRKFRARLEDDDDDDDDVGCSEEELKRSQQQFQNCTHSISSKLNDVVTNLQDSDTILTKLCQSINMINTECVEYLKLCSDDEDIAALTKSQNDQLLKYLLNLVGETKLSEESVFGIDNCKDIDETSSELTTKIVATIVEEDEEYINDDTDDDPVSSNLVTYQNTTATTTTEEPIPKSQTSTNTSSSGCSQMFDVMLGFLTLFTLLFDL